MITYKFDGTIDGIISCVFESFTRNEKPDLITTSNVQTCLDEIYREIPTNYQNNKRIITAMYRYVGINSLNDIKYAFRSGDELKANCIFNYVRKTLLEKKNISNKFSDSDVLAFYNTVKRIGTEVHRMKGFLRFNECEGQFFYAHFSPDNDIADLLLPHFKLRFKNIPFIIHDVRRNVLAMYNGEESKVVKCDKTITVVLSSDELLFQKLWKNYYDSVNIKVRKNEKLMRSFMPVRYHQHLTEKMTAN